MRLIDDDFFASHEDARQQMAALPMSRIARSAPFSRAADDTLRAFQFLTEFPDEVMARGYGPDDVFWSRYYWFQRYLYLHRAAHGCDGTFGELKELAFKSILENPYPDCDPDWSQAEIVDARAARDVEALIRRDGG